MAKWTDVMYSGELLDWGFDWSDALPSGVSISTSTWTVSPDVVVAKQTSASNITSVWITDVTGGETYTLTNRVALSDNVRSYDQSIVVQCVDSDIGGGVTTSTVVDTDANTMVWSDGSGWIFTEY
jgi:hypothetical protein